MGNQRGTPAEDWSHDRVLLLMEPGRDRQLLAEWLDGLGAHAVSTRDPSAGGPVPDTYDLCLLDAAALSARRGALEANAGAADPVFLPHLLVADGDRARRLDAAASSLVDDVLAMPARKAELRRRIEALLQSRRASVRLAERGDQYEELVDVVPEAILVVRDGAIAYANAAAADAFGTADADGLLGRPVAALLPDDGAAAFEDLLAEVRERDRTDGFREFELEPVAGPTLTALVAGVAVTYEGREACQLVVRDVTEERRRRERLTLFGRAIDAAAQGITIADARRDDYPLIYANEAFERITGYDSAEVLGRNCRFLQGRDTDPETVAEIREALENDDPVTAELLNYRKDGTPFWNRLDIVPVTDESGTVTHFLGLQRDVTERRQRTERLSVLDRVLRHNIRNRMNVIVGYAEQLRANADSEDAAAVEHVLGAANDLLRLAEQVRGFRGVVAGDDLDLVPVDLASALDRIVTGYRADHPDADVTLEGPGSATVRAHGTLPAAIEAVLELAAGAEGAPALDVTLRRDGPEVVVEVRDRGGTIPDEDLAVIDSAAESPLEHSEGLELWLVRWAVVASGGEFLVERSPARLKLRFAAADGDDRDPAAGPGSGEADGEGADGGTASDGAAD